MIDHRRSVLNNLAMAASSLMSAFPMSAMAEVSQATDSMANVSDAIAAIFSATASCLPMGAPH